MRGGLVAAVLLGALVWWAPSAGNAATPITPNAQNLMLRLVDLGPGYRFGNDDSGCPAERGEVEHWSFGDPFRVTYCTIQFRGPAPANDYVDSGAWVFEDKASALTGFKHHQSLLTFTNGLPGGPALTAPPIGDESTMYRGPNGWGGPTTSIVWRSGRVISFVAAATPTETAGTARATTLAQRQQARVLSPTALGPRDNSETWSFLDDPRLKFDVYWLGESFDPAGPLPKRSLIEADHWGGPGWMGRLIYGGAIDLGIWKPSRWVKFKHSKLGRHFLCKTCSRQIRPVLPGRRTTIFAIRAQCLARLKSPFAPGNDQTVAFTRASKGARCRQRPPNLFMAAVRIRDVVVSINVPVCFFCASVNRDPYNSARGMRAAAAALAVRVPER